MALLSWNETYSVKVKQFDDQHQKLIGLINRLHDAMKVGKGKEVIGDVLKALIDYTGTHFAAEERLMKLYKFPDYLEHKQEHTRLVLQVLDIQKKQGEGNLLITQEVLSFLKEWLQNHIQGQDKKYGPFLNDKGIV